MSASSRRHAVVVGSGSVDLRDEALRAALGLTLRGARVVVALTEPEVALGPGGQRARATLALFGHDVGGLEQLGAALNADTVEIWGRFAPIGPVEPVPHRLQLVRPGAAHPDLPEAATVVHLPDVLSDEAADRLLTAVLAAADNPIVW